MVSDAAAVARPAAAHDAGAAVRFVVPAEGQDFAEGLRRVVCENPGRDVIVLSRGAVLPFMFDERLRKGAYAAASIAAAVPMCDVSPLYALVVDEPRPAAAADAIGVDRSAYCMGSRAYYEVP